MEGKILESIMMGGIWVKVLGSMLYRNNVVCGDVNCINVIYGGTLPVLKNEIIDFFFARLGTGRTFTVPSRYGCVHMLIQLCKYMHAVSSVAMHNRRQRFISPIRRNVVGRLCIRPTIVFLILSNQKARVRALTSRRLGYRYIHDCE